MFSLQKSISFQKIQFSIFSMRFWTLGRKIKVAKKWISPTRIHFGPQNWIFRKGIFQKLLSDSFSPHIKKICISRKSTNSGGVVSPFNSKRPKSVGLFNYEGYYTQILDEYAGWGHFCKFWICNSPLKFGNFPHSLRSTDALNKSVPYMGHVSSS